MATADLIATCQRIEDYIWPRPNRDWFEQIELESLDAFTQEALPIFRQYARRWQGTVLLPVNQLILTLAQDLFEDPVELAITHKLAMLLRQAENANPDWRLGGV